eukprot:11162949-Karenia_brevis.AAC.1
MSTHVQKCNRGSYLAAQTCDILQPWPCEDQADACIFAAHPVEDAKPRSEALFEKAEVCTPRTMFKKSMI